MAYIYKITNLINGKIYVGKSEREDNYYRKNYFGSGTVIKSAIKKYGKENFKKDFLEENVKLSKLDERERYWISKLKSMDENIGYNRAYGGEGGCTKEAALKGAQTRKLHNYHHSEKTKLKMSLAAKGKTFSEEHKQNLRLNHHLRTEHILLYDDFSYKKFEGGYDNFCEKINITKIKLQRASEIFDFRYGFILFDLVNIENSFNHHYAGSSCKNLKVFKNPITDENVTATSYRIFRQHHLEECSKFDKFPWTVEMIQKKKEYFLKFEETQQKIKNNEDIKNMKEVFYVAYRRKTNK